MTSPLGLTTFQHYTRLDKSEWVVAHGCIADGEGVVAQESLFLPRRQHLS